MLINRFCLRKVIAIAVCLAAIIVFSGCNKDEVFVKFDKKTFIEQKKLWQLSNTKDYEYRLIVAGYSSYYGKIIVENGSFNNHEKLNENPNPASSGFSKFSTIDLAYDSIEEMFNIYNGTKKSDHYCTEIFVEYDKTNHIPTIISFDYYCAPNLTVDGNSYFRITNFKKY